MAKYMFTKACGTGLLCRVSGKDENEYYVINGAWDGIRNGDEFTVKRTKHTFTITDWEEVFPDKWPRAEQEQWYFY